MPFSDSTIISIAPPTFGPGTMTVSWTSSSPEGTWYQIYINLQLAWRGQTTTATVAVPAGPVNSCNIGTVLPGEQDTDFSSTFNGSNLFVKLEWQGGMFESPNLSGFYVYQSPTAGAAINYTTPVATIPAYSQGVVTDGYGQGGYGQGGYGSSANTYSWTSTALAGGLWNFAVAPFDTAGNVGTPQTCQVQIIAPPLEPAANPGGSRLTYSFNPSTEEATLTWLASPSA